MTEKPKIFRIRYQPYVSRFFELVITPKTVSWFVINVEKISSTQNAGPFREASPHVVEKIVEGHVVLLSKVTNFTLPHPRQGNDGKVEDLQRLQLTVGEVSKTTFEFPSKSISDAFSFLMEIMNEQ